MVNSITFITGNKGKYSDAIELFANSNIEVKQLSIDTPEIQSDNPEEISKYSAEFVSKTLKKPFFVMDRSFSIEALNGFPGPFVKYINKWLNEENLSKLLCESSDSIAKWITSVSCYIPNKEIITVSGENHGKVTLNTLGDEGYMIDKIFIPEGSDKTLAQMNEKERRDFWNSCECWNNLIEYLQEN